MKSTLKIVISVIVFSTISALALPTAGLREEPPVRIKNFREIYAAYASMMGLKTEDAELKTALDAVKDRLPRLGVPQELTSPAILAMTELSGAFCQKAVTKEKALSYGERILFSDINFKRGPVQFTDYLSETVSRKLAVIFWQRDISPEEIKVMTSFIQEAIKEDQVTVQETESIAKLLCVNFATSLAFITK